MLVLYTSHVGSIPTTGTNNARMEKLVNSVDLKPTAFSLWVRVPLLAPYISQWAKGWSLALGARQCRFELAHYN